MSDDRRWQNFLSAVVSGCAAVDSELVSQISSLVVECGSRDGRVFFVGNGGSAAIASHLAIDFTNALNIPAVCFSDASMLTCFSNDYGYELWVVKALQKFVDPTSDLVILISSSGESQNILNGAKFCLDSGIKFVTLSGFDAENKLNSLGGLSVHVDSRNYNVVESVHQMVLLGVVENLRESNA